jgi:hypothetical protein
MRTSIISGVPAEPQASAFRNEQTESGELEGEPSIVDAAALAIHREQRVSVSDIERDGAAAAVS